MSRPPHLRPRPHRPLAQRRHPKSKLRLVQQMLHRRQRLRLRSLPQEIKSFPRYPQPCKLGTFSSGESAKLARLTTILDKVIIYLLKLNRGGDNFENIRRTNKRIIPKKGNNSTSIGRANRLYRSSDISLYKRGPSTKSKCINKNGNCPRHNFRIFDARNSTRYKGRT